MNKKRESWNSNMGFILAAAGSAIGLGNLWKFPYLAGRNGGGAFVFIYIILVILLGFSLTLGEIAVGRNGRLDAFGSYNKIKNGWGYVGIIGIICCFLIYSYYVVIVGWIIKYVVIYLQGGISRDPAQIFEKFISSGVSPIYYTILAISLTSLIVFKGVSKGIEKASKIMMPALFIFILIILFRVITLPGAIEGIKYFLKPDFSLITPEVIIAALGQVFFSLSLGMGIIITYGSYLSKDENIVKNSFIIPLLDTAVALLSGLMILPAVFAFGLEPSAGPGLIFITLPKVFEAMKFGEVFGFMFFILVFFAALSSTISLMEVLVTFSVDQGSFKRESSVVFLSIIVMIVASFNSLSFGSMSELKVFMGMNFFDFLGYLTDNILLPLGGLLLCIFVGYIWKKRELKNEITNQGRLKFKLFNVWFYGVRYLGVQLLSLILLQSLGLTGESVWYVLTLILFLQAAFEVFEQRGRTNFFK